MLTAFQETDGYLVFRALMKGSPNYEYEIARVPAGAVAEWSDDEALAWASVPE